MKVHQISVFLENKPGRISEPCKVLAAAGINILTLALADTEQFGILRLVVKDWQRAKSVLEEAGAVVNVAEVVATEVEDKPGGLAELLKVVEANQLDIEYMYAFTFRREDKAVMIFRFKEPEHAIELLRNNGFNVLGSVELYERAGA